MDAITQQQSFALKEVISLKFRYHSPFERGMNEGAMSEALGINETGTVMGLKCGFIAKRENDAFASGFNLGKKYVDDWRATKDLLRVAVSNGDVAPKDFKSSVCPSSFNHYWDELTQ